MYEVTAREVNQKYIEVYRFGTYPEIVWVRIYEYLYNLEGFLVWFPSIPGAMLIGMGFARSGWLERATEQGVFYRKLILVCLLPAVVGKIVYIYGVEQFLAQPAFALLCVLVGAAFGGAGLGFVYLVGMRAWFQRAVVFNTQ